MAYHRLLKKTSETTFIERSVGSHLHVFAQYHFNESNLEQVELNVYTDLFNDYPTYDNSVYVYIRTDPTICFQRLNSRKRSEELTITLEYIQTLHDLYEKYILTIPNVIILDGNDTTDNIYLSIKKQIPINNNKKNVNNTK